MDKLVICTANPGKIRELRELLPPHVHLLSLADVGIAEALPETGDTLIHNALEKARHVHARTGLPCLADDTGLEVRALGGAPGAHAAHYAGPQRDAKANMERVLSELRGHTDRQACFRTVIAWVDADDERVFEGRVDGAITEMPSGDGGFGYDPVFRPEGEARTFAQMGLAEKNALSHRARAVAAFATWFGARTGTSAHE